MSDRFVVIARDGLKLRAGASQEFPALRTIPEGTVLNVISRQVDWALVDLEGDDKADGFVNLSFLRPIGDSGPAAGASAAAGPGDVTGLVSPQIRSGDSAGQGHS